MAVISDEKDCENGFEKNKIKERKFVFQWLILMSASREIPNKSL